jgi:cytosol alanyl aminopeptidase
MRISGLSALHLACGFVWVALYANAAEQPPKLRLAEVQSVSPTRYRAELSLDPDKPQFSATIQIGLDVQKPLETLWLNATSLAVEEASLTAAGKTWVAKAFTGGTDFLGLHFEAAIPAGPVDLRIRYTGSVRQDSSGVFRAEDLGNRYILTQFEATYARAAFPCFDEPSYKVPWQLTLRVPERDKAVSNTPVARETSEGDARKYVFKETKPLPSYLIAFGVGPFEFVDAGSAGKKHVPVRIVVPKGRSGEAKYAAEVTATILTRLEDYFGIPYPYEKSDQVAVPALFGAMENAGMVAYEQRMLLAKPASDSIQRQRRYATVAAHELAHQWFGDLVTTAWWNDLWLNEAFATWMEEKLVAEWKPEWKTRLGDVQSMLAAERADSLVSARKIRQEIASQGDIDNAADSITYDKGAAVIGMFERWVGPDEFRKGVRSYLERYSFRNATAGDFLDALSSSSKKNVTKAFATFLDQPGVPLLSVALDCGGKTPVLHLSQSRYVPVGSQSPPGQLWNIPVCMRYGTASPTSNGQPACTLLTQAKTDWPLAGARSCPQWVEANADAHGYYRVDYQAGLMAALTGGDIPARLNAAERTEIMGSVRAMAAGGKLPAAEALRLAEKLHDDPERNVVSSALAAALSIQDNLVSEDLLPNYRRYLLRNFQSRAHELGWTGRPGETDDVRLLRPDLLSAVATTGGDEELARQARELAERWLKDRGALSPEMVSTVLTTAAYHGDSALHGQLVAEVENTQDRQEQQQLIRALASFRDRNLLESGLEEVLAGRIPLRDALTLLVNSGFQSPNTRNVPFDFLQAHFDQLMAGNPSIMGLSLGAVLPNVGRSFCDAVSRRELVAFFSPLTKKYDGAQHNLDETLETVDQCIALVAAQGASVREFLERY